jgi:hypothetical protein
MTSEEWEKKRALIVETLEAIVARIDELEARFEAKKLARAEAAARRKRRRLFGLL